MNDKYKTSKGDLIAIYRLEFYKKQKNWKLSHVEKKKKNTSEPSVKPVLNKTYDVDSAEPQVEPLSPLNDAFLADESDKDIPSPTEDPKPPSLKSWFSRSVSLQELKAHEHSVWAEENNNWMTPMEASQRGYIEPIKQYSGEWWPSPDPQLTVTSELQPDKWTPAEYEPKYCCQGAREVQPWSAPGPCDPGVPCTCWSDWQQLARECLLTGQSTCMEEMGEPAVAGEMGEGNEGGGGESLGTAHTVLKTADAWLRAKDNSHLDWESCSVDVSVDSAWSFLRGARAAPHSSELELTPFTPCSCVCEPRHVSSLPVSALAASLAQHAAVLRAILRELRARHQHAHDDVHAPYIPASNTSQERPTRDTGPSLPRPPPAPVPDPFVAGSSLPGAGLLPAGRGRGRRLIGIGMGRPYRL